MNTLYVKRVLKSWDISPLKWKVHFLSLGSSRTLRSTLSCRSSLMQTGNNRKIKTKIVIRLTDCPVEEHLPPGAAMGNMDLHKLNCWHKSVLFHSGLREGAPDVVCATTNPTPPGPVLPHHIQPLPVSLQPLVWSSLLCPLSMNLPLCIVASTPKGPPYLSVEAAFWQP